MKNILALVFGIGAMIVALIVASGTTSNDSASRPEAALAMATAFHVTPSATPTETATPLPTSTPGPTPTPLHLLDSEPSGAQILALLFQYPQQGSLVTPTSDVSVERVPLAGVRQDMLLVVGEGAKALHQGRLAPVAYGAVLLWLNDEYTVVFEHAEFGHRDARVIYTFSPEQGEVRFIFQDIGIDPKSARELRRYFTLSCSSAGCRVIKATAGITI